MKRIWMNHWFSSAYNIAKLIKDDNSDFFIIGSNENLNSPIKNACDQWFKEPSLTKSEYVDYCLNFAKEHNIDVFMPRRGMVEISKRKEEFEKNGIKVMADDFSFVSLLNDKQLAYDFFKENGIGNVPEYRIFSNMDEFINAYNELSKKYDKLCFKYVTDEGAVSFRVIDNDKCDEIPFRNYGTHLTYSSVVKILGERDSIPSMMLMPYLKDEEISVDCLKTSDSSDGIIMIPRIKGNTRVEKIRYDKNIIDTCRKFFHYISLENPCNIQFKYIDDVPYILEVNTRMSGGIQMSCLASGINIPSIAVNKLLGIEKKWSNKMEEKNVSYFECPLVL